MAGIYNFFAPPLFIPDDCTLPLRSKLFSTGTVNVSDDIGYGQSVEVGYVVHDYFNPSVIYDTPIAWKGRNLVPAGGSLFEGQKADTLTLDAGTTPDVELLLWRAGFDGFGTSQVVGGESAIEFSFSAMRTKMDGSPAPVSGTAHATGAVVPTAMFNGWRIQGYPSLWCGDHAPLWITPLDSSGAQYSPAHSEMMSGTFTVSVQAKGDYAYLQYGMQEGKQVTVTIPQENTCYLVLDTERGYIPDDVDIAIVTVTGGGKSMSRSFILECERFDHLAIVASSDTLLDGSSVSLKVVAQDVYNQEITPPAGLNVTLELWYQGGLSVDGSALAHDTTLTYEVAHSGKVRYVAPDSSDDGMECGNVWIDVYRAEDGDKWAYTDLTFAKPYCAQVIVDPPKLAPGQTATVTFQKTGGQDMFDVAILANDTTISGTLVSSSGARGLALQADRGTVQYVAPSSITGDSVVVSIKASSYGICEGMPMHIAVPDVSKNRPGPASTQSLKKKASLSKIKSFASLKKVVRQRAAQPLSMQDQKTIMLSIAKRVTDNTCPVPAKAVVTSNKKRIPTSIKLNPDRTTLVPPDLLYLYVVLKDANGEIDATKNETDARIDFSVGSEFEKFGELHRTDTIGPPGMILTGVKYGPPGVLDCDKLAYDERFPLRVNVSASVSHNETINDVKTIEVVGSHTVGRYFNQGNTDWSTDTLDTYVLKKKGTQIDSVNDAGNLVYGTIQNAGCTMSCIAMVLKAFGCDVDPRKLNVWMKENPPSFASGNNGNIGDWIKILLEYPGSTVGPTMEVGRGLKWEGGTLVKPTPAYTAPLEYNLSLGYPSIVQIVNRHSDGRETAHWVLVTGKTLAGQYTILDPGDKAHVTLDPDSTPIYKYREIVRR